jgi:23S rRNA pseudouridine1911/1915/1917 synthase
MEEIKIIYEDDDIIAVNKPAGLLVHGVNLKSQKSNFKSLADWLLKKYPEIKNVGEDPKRPGIVHRLDKDTSGVLLVAKNQKSFDRLKSQFQDRKIRKTYLVLVDGIIKDNLGIIDLPIGKSKKDFRKKEAHPEAGLRGRVREAITEYKVLKRFKKFTLVEVFPKTGRTHQIRVHFKAIGHPVVGDKLYGPKEAPLDRQFLHANSLELTLLGGARIKLEADLPEDLKNFLNMLNYDYDKN